LAQALTVCGRHGESLSALREAAALAEETGERYVEAEIYRLQGNLLLAQGDDRLAVEASYSKALEVSRAQEARSLELRAAGDLARLWGDRGDRGQAYDLLAQVYNCFTESLNTIDLKEAKILLDALAS
jgi:adenylate cyclase